MLNTSSGLSETDNKKNKLSKLILETNDGCIHDSKFRLDASDFNEKRVVDLCDVDGDICFLFYDHWYKFPVMLPTGCASYLAKCTYLTYSRWLAIQESITSKGMHLKYIKVF